MVDYYFKLKQLLITLLPQVCALCSEPVAEAALCAACTARLPVIEPCCSHCGISLPCTAVCPDCLKRPPVYDHCVAGLQYSYPVDRLIQAMKYRGQLHLLASLMLPLSRRLANLSGLPDCLVPVPLHVRRLGWRGYNQAGLIARELSRRLDLPCIDQMISRTRHTQEQARLGPTQRKANISKAFRLNAAVNYQHVAIIDDVVTTGATCNELAHLLKQAGVQRVVVWALARAGSR